MAYAPLFILCIVLFELFALLRIVKDARAIIARSREAMSVLRSAELGDDEKEAFVRRASAATLGATLRFATKFLVIGLILYLLFLLAIALFPDLKEGMLASLVSPAGIAILTGGTVCYAWVRQALVARL